MKRFREYQEDIKFMAKKVEEMGSTPKKWTCKTSNCGPCEVTMDDSLKIPSRCPYSGNTVKWKSSEDWVSLSQPKEVRY